MNITEKDIIGELVASDYRTASIFKAHKLDFCCQGNRTIGEACQKRNVQTEKVLEALNNLEGNDSENQINFKAWDMDLLADYIEKKHHRYVLNKIPELKAFLNKVARVHGERHPELLQIESLFTASAEALLDHMHKEEKILFPLIRSYMKEGVPAESRFSVNSPIAVMMQEHDNEGRRFEQIAELSNNYTPPADACTTYRVSFEILREFEDDLHTHIHLENNILFPKAIEYEQAQLVM